MQNPKRTVHTEIVCTVLLSLPILLPITHYLLPITDQSPQ